MKRFILAAVLFLGVTAAVAQQSTEVTEFSNYSITMDKSRQAASRAKDYNGALKVLNEWMDKYDKLSATSQASFKGYIPGMYYNLACYYALSNQKESALNAFEKAVAAGYANYANVSNDTDLDDLRKEPRFKAALLKIREKGDYGYILKKSGPYKVKSAKGMPQFTYQAATAPQLIAFKQQFNLDSVAGNGNETERFKRLLYWVHNVVPHDGNSNNPKSKNGIDLIAVCKKDSRGVNCRMMATILRDAYQAEGFPSRVVTCMPKDTADFDCHVITVVWSKTLNKWVWMDPTFNAYVSDDKGNLLNIEEVRNRLIAGQPLVLNDDANWNNKQKQTKAQYLDYYMSKNMFWLQCAVKSEWDLETRKPGMANIEYINLYPGTYSTIGGALTKTSGDIKTVVTNDPAYFWQKPKL